MFWNGDNLYVAKNHKYRTACALSKSLSVQMSKTKAKRPRVSERERDQVRRIFKVDFSTESLINNLGEFNKHNWHNYYSNSETRRLI